MKHKYLVLLFLVTSYFALPSVSVSQNVSLVKGFVYGQDARPVEFATVALLAALDSTVNGGTTTDATGRFQLEGIKPGQYVLQVHYLGYSPSRSQPFSVAPDQVLEVPTIQLQPRTAMLAEVEITAQKPLIEMVGGKVLYYVEGNQALIGIYAREVLASAPGVTSDRRGYQLNGRPGAKILIDGRDRNVTLESALSSLRAEDILRVELLANPSAHYDAQGAGGVINIITKQSTYEGLSGTYGLSGSTGRERIRYSSNLGLNYKSGIVTLFGDIRINRFTNRTKTESTQQFEESQGASQRQSGVSDLTSTVPSASMGGEFRLSPKSQLGFELWGSDGQSESRNDTRREATLCKA